MGNASRRDMKVCCVLQSGLSNDMSDRNVEEIARRLHALQKQRRQAFLFPFSTILRGRSSIKEEAMCAMNRQNSSTVLYDMVLRRDEKGNRMLVPVASCDF